MSIPERNAQFGYMVGGTWNSSDYKDAVMDYAMTEGGIDYNAGLVGVLGYIVSKLDPADTVSMMGTPVLKKELKANYTKNIVIKQTGKGLFLYFSDHTPIAEIMVYNCKGRLVYKSGIQQAVSQLLLMDLCSGVYTLCIRSVNGNNSIKKFILLIDIVLCDTVELE